MVCRVDNIFCLICFVAHLPFYAHMKTIDKWVSTLHRVVIPPTVERRYSMAYFVNINGDTLVETLGADKAKYPPITAKEHLMVKHLASMSEAKHDEL